MGRFIHLSIQEPLPMSALGIGNGVGEEGTLDQCKCRFHRIWGLSGGEGYIQGKKKLSIMTRFLLRLQGRWYWDYKERQKIQKRARWREAGVETDTEILLRQGERQGYTGKRYHYRGNAHGQ